MDPRTKTSAPSSPPQHAVPLSTFNQSGPYYQQAAEPPFYQRPSLTDSLLPPLQSQTRNIVFVQQDPVRGSFRKRNKVVLTLAFVVLTVLFIGTIVAFMRRLSDAKPITDL
ncbi:uncharacterized protein LOC107272135 [Cephus cinctus]|uniref:Uncharacterized protein LOC107272135 n=1 Tax=Cephus cinctus TaxID=211228 RepID=A0AAJ7FRC5_CEPCN|nr:uncharacterized protein LOC107272135 [Cephus cinctus]